MRTVNPEYALSIRLEPIKTQFIAGNKKYHQACADTNGKPEYINSGKKFVSAKIPTGKSQIFYYHFNRCVI